MDLINEINVVNWNARGLKAKVAIVIHRSIIHRTLPDFKLKVIESLGSKQLQW